MFDMHECERNAFLLAQQTGLEYREGVALVDRSWGYHHSFCTTPNGGVVDNTWKDAEACLYAYSTPQGRQIRCAMGDRCCQNKETTI